MPALSEYRNSGQIQRVAEFLTSTFNSQAFPFHLYDLRAVDVSINDDMLCCLDALRWGKADLHVLVPNGEKWVLRVLEQWGIDWPEASDVNPLGYDAYLLLITYFIDRWTKQRVLNVETLLSN